MLLNYLKNPKLFKTPEMIRISTMPMGNRRNWNWLSIIPTSRSGKKGSFVFTVISVLKSAVLN